MLFAPIVEISLTCYICAAASHSVGYNRPSLLCRSYCGIWISTSWSGSWRGTTTMCCLVSFHQMGHCWLRPLTTPESSCGIIKRAASCWSWGTTHMLTHHTAVFHCLYLYCTYFGMWCSLKVRPFDLIKLGISSPGGSVHPEPGMSWVRSPAGRTWDYKNGTYFLPAQHSASRVELVG